MVIGVSELQKNISIFKNLTESVQIIDKRTKEVLALVLSKSQMQTVNLTDALGGILQKNKAIKKYDDLDDMLCAKEKLEGFKIISFDKDIECCQK